MSAQTKSMATGPAAAAMIAAGIGSFFLGLFTTLAEASADFKNAIVLYKPVGPLSGKTVYAVGIWLVAWVILGYIWKDKDFDLGKAFTWTLVLVALGFALTFPPIFTIFAAE